MISVYYIDEILGIRLNCLITFLVLILGLFFIVSQVRRSNKKAGISPSNETVFITGCDSGIGFEYARLCDKLGFNVFAGCLVPGGEGARRLLAETKRVQVVDLDITNEDKVQKAFELIKRKLSNNGLWCLVNNAGVLYFGELQWLTWAQCQKQVNVNLLGTIYITKIFLPLIKKRKGRIVTITSINGLLAYPLMSVYCATKFALEGFCDSLRCEVERYDVSVVCLELGDFAKLTNITAKHEENAQIMWDAMSESEKEECGDYFGNIQNMVKKYNGYTSPKSLSQSRLYNDMESAVLSQKPRNRYLCVPFRQKIIFWVIFLLPYSSRDALISFIFQKIVNMHVQTE